MQSESFSNPKNKAGSLTILPLPPWKLIILVSRHHIVRLSHHLI